MKRRLISLAGAIAALLAGGSALIAPTVPARAQYGYVCPRGYHYDPTYGCVPYGYFGGPPYYAYPDFGFDFFYGGGWGGRGRGAHEGAFTVVAGSTVGADMGAADTAKVTARRGRRAAMRPISPMVARLAAVGVESGKASATRVYNYTD